MKQSISLVIMIMSIFVWTACGNGGASGAAEAVNTDGFILTDVGGGVKKAVKESAKKGQLSEEGYLKGGSKEGNWMTYHEKNGMPAIIQSYRNGKKDGAYIKLDDRGQMTERGNFLNGLQDGNRIKYNRSRVKEEASFKAGKQDGIYKSFYDDGKLQQEGLFKAGKRDGYAKYYNKTEQLIMEYQYSNGEKTGGGKVDAPKVLEGEAGEQ